MNIVKLFKAVLQYGVSMSWGASAVRNITPIRSFEEADAHFKHTSLPRSKYWRHNTERPLYKTSAPQYTLYNGGDFYDCVLYGTPLVRYMRPEGAKRVVYLGGDTRQASYAFVEKHGFSHWRGLPTKNGTVKVPRNPDPAEQDVARDPALREWSARLVFEGGLLIPDNSSHRAVYVRRSSAADKRARAEARAKLETWIELMVLRMPSFEDLNKSQKTQWRAGRPFGARSVRVQDRDILQGSLGAEVLSSEGVDALCNVARAVHSDLDVRNRYMNRYAAEDIPTVTQEQFRRALVTVLLEIQNLDTQSLRIALPQFPAGLPRKYSF